MELIIQATDSGLFGLIFGAGAGFVLFGLIFAVATDGDALPVSVAFMFLGFSGMLFALLTGSSANERAQENFTLAAAEQLNIENPTPLGDEEEIGECHMGGKSAASQYLWLNEDGEPVKGLIMRSPEQNGECVFTLSATS